MAKSESLTAEAVESASLTLKRIDHVHGGHSLPFGVLGVGHGITDNVLQEHLQYTACLFIDQARNTLDPTAASQAADGGLCDMGGDKCPHTPTQQTTVATPDNHGRRYAKRLQ